MPDPGKFVWYELMSTDAAAAERFYRDVVGWGIRRTDNPRMPYTTFLAGETGVAGLMTLTRQMQADGGAPGWVCYISTNDVDAAAKAVRAAGGAIYLEPSDIPDIGRFAMAADPQGALFVLFQASGPGMESPASTAAPGHGGWHELRTSDLDGAWDFYAKLFGWTKTTAMDMGPAGPYQLFAAGAGDIGGMMRFEGRPFWKIYFNVADIGAAAKAIAAGGGKILNGPMEVPGGAWMVEGADPQGVTFALSGPRGSA
ncbi:MAG TPA: VOC family protein [Hyphomicrobiales bacterium]|nr:VOC family protein [Hyphomicrobiales bacterium]